MNYTEDLEEYGNVGVNLLGFAKTLMKENLTCSLEGSGDSVAGYTRDASAYKHSDLQLKICKTRCQADVLSLRSGRCEISRFRFRMTR